MAEKNGILAANVKNFFANPFVKEFQHLMKSKEFQVIRNYINVIAHSTFDDLSQINAIEEKLSKLVPHVPEKDARAIKAIIKKLPEIVRLLTFADKLTRKK